MRANKKFIFPEGGGTLQRRGVGGEHWVIAPRGQGGSSDGAAMALSSCPGAQAGALVWVHIHHLQNYSLAVSQSKQMPGSGFTAWTHLGLSYVSH